jgi:hypothetical protein
MAATFVKMSEIRELYCRVGTTRPEVRQVLQDLLTSRYNGGTDQIPTDLLTGYQLRIVQDARELVKPMSS